MRPRLAQALAVLARQYQIQQQRGVGLQLPDGDIKQIHTLVAYEWHGVIAILMQNILEYHAGCV